MAEAVDDTARSAFIELQSSLMATTTQLRQLQQSAQQKDSDVRRAKLVQEVRPSGRA